MKPAMERIEDRRVEAGFGALATSAAAGPGLSEAGSGREYTGLPDRTGRRQRHHHPAFAPVAAWLEHGKDPRCIAEGWCGASQRNETGTCRGADRELCAAWTRT